MADFVKIARQDDVLILEIDGDRRRLSLSLKRVEDGMPIQPAPGEEAAAPTIDLSEDVFSDQPSAEADVVEELVVNDVDPSVPVEPGAVAESSAAEETTDEESPAASADDPGSVSVEAVPDESAPE